MNIECDGETLAELEGIFRFNDAVLRHLTVRREEAVVEQSIMMKAKEEKDRPGRSYGSRDRDDDDDDSDDDDVELADDSDDEEEAAPKQSAEESTKAASAESADA
jgi:small subunit ribosomal protein S6